MYLIIILPVTKVSILDTELRKRKKKSIRTLMRRIIPSGQL